MSSRGEIDLSLVAVLRSIADKIADGTVTKADADVLRKIAADAAGEGKEWILKLHKKPGAPRQGRAGVQRRFAMALAIQAHRDEHGGTLAEAYQALNGKFGNAGPDTLEKAWKEMAPALRMPEDRRRTWLFFHGLAAEGKVTITRRGK